MSLKMDEVSIRCMGCFQQKTLEQAVREGWQMCKTCQFAICMHCYQEIGEVKKCLSYICQQKNNDIMPIPIPIERILVFAQENSQNEYKQGLLYKLFYEERERMHTPAFFIVQEKKTDVPENEKPTKIQEEIWKNFQLVVTKRKGGKFINWERVL